MGLILDFGYLLGVLAAMPWFLYRITVRGDWRSIPRRMGFGQPPPARGSIWLHGSSAGEISLLGPLIGRLSAEFPAAPIVISAYSSTGFAAARKMYPDARVIFFPLDLSFIVRRFLRRYDPRLVVIVESDFWPNFLRAARARAVPVTVINGKMSERSCRIHARIRLVPQLLRSMPLIAVQSEEHASRFRQLGVAEVRVAVTGNMKYDLTVPEALPTGESRRALNYQPDDVVIIGGSLRDGENGVMAECYRSLVQGHPRVGLILVPRYPTEAARIQADLEAKAMHVVRKSEIDADFADAPGCEGVLLVDTVGELRALYGVADIAYVGGSLFARGSNKGGHSVIEPAILGVPVIFGPHHFSFRDTVDDLLAADAGIRVGDAVELREALEQLLADRERCRRMGRRAREAILRRQGATAGNYDLLATHLEALRERRASPPPALWSLAAYLLLPYALFNLVWRGLRYPAYWSRWPERFGYGASVEGGRSIWIHAVSVGEVRSAAQLVHSLGRRYPDHRLMVTTGTPTGSEQVRELFADRVSHSYVPYDLPGAVRRFMDRVKPEFAIVAETELWPNLFGECGKRGIPLILVNVRISPDSLRRYKRVPVATNAMLANADLLCAQSSKDAEQLEDLGVSRHLIHVTGNLKFDAQVEESVLAEGRKLRRQWGRERFVLIAASTHPGEERRVLEAFGRLKARIQHLLLVVVPRHPERFTRVVRLCRLTGHNVVRRTEHVGELAREVDIVVGDTMGELQKLYAASNLAFVGGSLVEVGGHNILEACAVGVPVIFGPYMFQAEEASSMALERGAARRVADTVSLTDAVRTFVEQPELLETAAGAARALVADNRGALGRTLELIDSALVNTCGDTGQGAH